MDTGLFFINQLSIRDVIPTFLSYLLPIFVFHIEVIGSRSALGVEVGRCVWKIGSKVFGDTKYIICGHTILSCCNSEFNRCSKSNKKLTTKKHNRNIWT